MPGEEKALAIQPKSQVAIENGQLVPKDFDGLYRIAAIMAASGMVPSAYANKPEAIFVAIQMGMEVGLRHMAAVQNIAVVDGRPTIYSDGITGLLHGSGKVQSIVEWFETGGEKVDPSDLPLDLSQWAQSLKAVSEITRLAPMAGGEAVVYRGSFSVSDAMRMGKWNKPTSKGYKTVWQNHPARMLMWRARTYAARDGFSDVLKGLAIYEEVVDYVADAEYEPAAETTNHEAESAEVFQNFCKVNGIDFASASIFIEESARVSGMTAAMIIEAAVANANDFISKYTGWYDSDTAENKEPEVNPTDTGIQAPALNRPEPEEEPPAEAEPPEEPVAEKPQIVTDLLNHLLGSSTSETPLDLEAVEKDFYEYVDYVSSVQKSEPEEIIALWGRLGLAKWTPYFLNWVDAKGESAAYEEDPKDTEEEPEEAKPEDSASEEGPEIQAPGLPVIESFIKEWVGKQGTVYHKFVLANPDKFDPAKISIDEFNKAKGKWDSLVKGRFTEEDFPYGKNLGPKKMEIEFPVQNAKQKLTELMVMYPNAVSEAQTKRKMGNTVMTNEAAELIIKDVVEITGGKVVK